MMELLHRAFKELARLFKRHPPEAPVDAEVEAPPTRRTASIFADLDSADSVLEYSPRQQDTISVESSVDSYPNSDGDLLSEKSVDTLVDLTQFDFHPTVPQGISASPLSSCASVGATTSCQDKGPGLRKSADGSSGECCSCRLMEHRRRQHVTANRIPIKQPQFYSTPFEDIARKVEKQMMCLEHCIQTMPDSVTGFVRVRKVAKKRKVFIRYSDDGWKTYHKAVAVRVFSPDDASDRYIFELPLKRTVEFAMCYKVKKTKYWDNNSGKSYVIPKPKSEN